MAFASLLDIVYEPTTLHLYVIPFVPGLLGCDAFSLVRICVILLVAVEVNGGYFGVVCLENNDCRNGSRRTILSWFFKPLDDNPHATGIQVMQGCKDPPDQKLWADA